MRHADQVQQTFDRLVEWGQARDEVRAIVLTSTLAIPNGQVDALSDYDPIVVVTDIHPFFESRAWLGDFGSVLAVYRDPIQLYYGEECFGSVTQYEDGLKIDFTLWPVALMQKVAAEPQLPEEFDAGYRVLLDKDGLTRGLNPPTYQGYIPQKPTEGEYLERVELLFHNATYVVKYLWRDDLVAAKHVLETGMRQEDLLPMLVWRIEIDHDWSWKPGPYGRGLKRRLRPDLWAQLEKTYAGPGLEESWTAMWQTIGLFRQVAIEVGDKLGYAYPHDFDKRATAYLRRVENLDRDAEVFA